MSSGRPICLAYLWAMRGEVTSGAPGMTGTPAACMVLRAFSLSPSFSIKSGPGPMKVMPQSPQSLAKRAFSLSRP